VAKAATGMKEAAIALHTQLEHAPADRVLAECHTFWQTWGTLPSKPVDLAGLRRKALAAKRAEGRRNGVEVGFIARSLGLSPNRFSRLTGRAVEEVA
jgi:hypothetical protein